MTLKENDLGLLLYDLCVVDVDTKEQASALEKRFPELLKAPAVTTKRGVHYYFARSPLADKAGYYDSHGAVEEGIDFKSRCFSGGRGLVLIPPSSGKEWLRKPWELFPSGALPDISDALLAAVAAPAHPPITIRVRAAGAAPDSPGVDFTSSVLASASFFQARESFQSLAGGAGGGEGQPLEHTLEEGYSTDDVSDLIRLAEAKEALHGESLSPSQYEDHLRCLLKLADFLGLQEGAMAQLRAQGPGGGRNRADLMRVDAAWASEVILAAKRTERIDR